MWEPETPPPEGGSRSRFQGERSMSEPRADAGTLSFFDLYSRGEASPDDIEDHIGRWHDAYKGVSRHPPLHEFLGLTRMEYEAWLYDPFALPYILQARRSGRKLVEVMAERYEALRASNREADGTILFSLGNWLKTQSAH
jgi:hypothetical protein